MAHTYSTGEAFGKLRSYLNQVEPWSDKDRVLIFRLMKRARREDISRYEEEWLPYMKSFAHRWVEPLVWREINAFDERGPLGKDRELARTAPFARLGVTLVQDMNRGPWDLWEDDYDAHCAIGPRGGEVIGEDASMSNVSALHIPRADFESAQLEFIFRAKACQNLTEVVIESMSHVIRVGAIEAMVEAPMCRRLRRLTLPAIYLDGAALKTFTSGRFDALQTLEFLGDSRNSAYQNAHRERNTTDNLVKLIFDQPTQYPSLSRLRLSGGFHDGTLTGIARAGLPPSLRVLDLRDNTWMTKYMFAKFLDTVDLSSLEVLMVRDRLDPGGRLRRARGLKPF